jgi:LPXTG-motif cell wall-anchored protein
LKKVMLLAAMLAMVLAVAVPALAQTAVVGQDCVQTAVNQETGKDQTAVANGQYGDATNINIQAISQQCNVTVAQVSAVVASTPGVAASTAQYNAPAAAQYQYSASATASASASATASASASASTAPATELPSTGGSSLIALGAGVLLVAGGLLARRIVR